MSEPSPNTIDRPGDACLTGDPTSASTGSPPLPAAPAGERYWLRDEIARGGMGVIWRATDTALGREVAVKVLQDKYGPDSGIARRFADEARITAQLQHPAIPPVHDLGALPDGRPFLAMKLIKGQTLDELLRARPDPSAERGRFVAVFEQVCQAVAYAHAHGVIHRDLKPANVMVGAYGEVQLMDWGLAKVLVSREGERPQPDPEATRAGTEVASLRDSDSACTQAGSILGTPAYMPPEQAAGVVGKVDQRSDVFGLGAILAVILTGQPPFAAASAESTRGLAALGDVGECFARLDGCGAELELVALCKRCLNPKTSERPADGGEVTAAVARLRQAAEERARAAELERVRAEGERVAAELRALEERKRRRAQRALALAVGLLLLSGLAFGWWQAEQGRAARERQARNAEAVTGLLEQCEQALRAGDATAAAVTLEAAQKRAAEGGAESEAERVSRRQEDLAVLRDLNAIDQFRWLPVNNKLPKNAEVAPRYHAALGRFGADPDAVGAEATAARVAGSAVREQVGAALDRLLLAERSAAVRATLQALDADPFRDAVRDAVRNKDRRALGKLMDQAEMLEHPPGFAAFLGDRELIDLPQRRRGLLRAALQRHPHELSLLMELGGSYRMNQREDADERVRWYQAAVAVAPHNPAPQVDLGVALLDKGDAEGAIAVCLEAIRLDPKLALAYNNLGLALKTRGYLDKAIAAYQEAIRLDPKLALAHYNLGLALYDKQDPNGAIAAWKEAIRVDPNLVLAHNNLGYALQNQGDLDGAIAAYQEALRIDPGHSLVRVNLSRARQWRELLSRLPDVLAGKGKPKSASEACQLAHLCLQAFLKRYADGVRLFEDAFAADPRLAEDLKSYHRYDAACCAALAGCGKGKDAAKPEARARLRAKAMEWLRADLDLLRRQYLSENAAQRQFAAVQLAHWLEDADLEGMRPGPNQVSMPAEERAAWDQLWADVRATLALAQKAPTATTGK